ncbi:MAG: hypothetical protein JOS17DRAFT_88495 [Linnemannia elongata]|nr:MAG: hypothetical protein JOS17DRAFT_88495 [Linnemannia elongata]
MPHHIHALSHPTTSPLYTLTPHPFNKVKNKGRNTFSTSNCMQTKQGEVACSLIRVFSIQKTLSWVTEKDSVNTPLSILAHFDVPLHLSLSLFSSFTPLLPSSPIASIACFFLHFVIHFTTLQPSIDLSSSRREKRKQIAVISFSLLPPFSFLFTLPPCWPLLCPCLLSPGHRSTCQIKHRDQSYLSFSFSFSFGHPPPALFSRVLPSYFTPALCTPFPRQGNPIPFTLLTAYNDLLLLLRPIFSLSPCCVFNLTRYFSCLYC